MDDAKQLLASMLKSQESLAEAIQLLISSQKLPIATCQHMWDPGMDTIWAFKMRRVSQIEVPDFISSFCDNPYFQEYNDSNDDLVICPIGLYTETGELRSVASQAIEGLEKLFKDKEWWDKEDHAIPSNFDKNLEKVAKTVYSGFNGEYDLKGSIIFRGSGHFTAIVEIEKFLSGLGVLDFDTNLETAHFNVGRVRSDGTDYERVTVFEYD